MPTPPAPDLALRTAAAILGTSESDRVQVQFLRRDNHIWRIEDRGSTYFLKAHTKDWYGGSPEAAARAVVHEVTGYRLLTEAGLPSAEVAASAASCDNPLGWPHLMTRQVDGTALVDLLHRVSPTQLCAVLRVVGHHLARVHALRFDHAGYLRTGPPRPAAPGDSVHWVSRPERFVLYLAESLVAGQDAVSLATRDRVASLLLQTLPALTAAYRQPRFVHGDCHPNTIFLTRRRGRWQVGGIVDMETCSAGCPMFDLAKLFIVLAGHLDGTSRWWEPLLDAYGPVPDFDLMRLALAGHAHRLYALGEHAWPGTRQDILLHILDARDWAELLDLSNLHG